MPDGDDKDFNERIAERRRMLEGLTEGSDSWHSLTDFMSGGMRQVPDQGPDRNAATSNGLGGSRTNRVVQFDSENNVVARMVVSDSQMESLATNAGNNAEYSYRLAPNPQSQDELDALTAQERAMWDWWNAAARKERREQAYDEAEPMGTLAGMGMDILSAVPGAATAVEKLFGEEIKIDGKSTGVTDIGAAYAGHEEQSPWTSNTTYFAANVIPAVLTGGLSTSATAARLGVAGIRSTGKEVLEQTGRQMGNKLMSTASLAALRKLTPYMMGGGVDIAVGKGIQRGLLAAGMSARPNLARRLAEGGAGTFGAIRDHMTDVMLDERKDFSAETIVTAGVVGGVLGIGGDYVSGWVGGRITRNGVEALAKRDKALAGILWGDLETQADLHKFNDFLSDKNNVDEVFDKITDLLKVGTDEEIAKLPFAVKMMNVIRWGASGGAADLRTFNRLATPSFQRGLEFAHTHLGKGDSEVFMDMGRVVGALMDGGQNLRRLEDIATGSRALAPEAQQSMDQVTPLSAAPGAGEAPSVRITPDERIDLLIGKKARIPFTVTNQQTKTTVVENGVPTEVGSPMVVPNSLRETMFSYTRAMDRQMKPQAAGPGKADLEAVPAVGGSSREEAQLMAQNIESLFGVPVGMRQIEVVVPDGAGGATTKTEWTYARFDPVTQEPIVPLGSKVTAEIADSPAWKDGQILGATHELTRVLGQLDAGESIVIREAGEKAVTNADRAAQLTQEVDDLSAAVREAISDFDQGKVVIPGAASTRDPKTFKSLAQRIAKRTKEAEGLLKIARSNLQLQAKGGESAKLAALGKSLLAKQARGGQVAKSAMAFRRALKEQGREADPEYADLLKTLDEWEKAAADLDGMVGEKGTWLKPNGALDKSVDATQSWVPVLERLRTAELKLGEALQSSEGAFPSIAYAGRAAAPSKGPPPFLDTLAKKLKGDKPADLAKWLLGKKGKDLRAYLDDTLEAAEGAEAGSLAYTQAGLARSLVAYLRGWEQVTGEAIPELKGVFGRMVNRQGEATFTSAYKDLLTLRQNGGGRSGQAWNVLQNVKKNINAQTKDRKTLAFTYDAGMESLDRLRSLTESEHLWGQFGLGQAQLNAGLNGLITAAGDLKTYLGKYATSASLEGGAVSGASPMEQMKAAMFGKQNQLPDGQLPRMLAQNMQLLATIMSGARRQGVSDEAMYQALGGFRPAFRDGPTNLQAAARGRELNLAFPRILGDAVEIQNALQAQGEMARFFSEQWQRAGLVRNGGPGWVGVAPQWAGGNRTPLNRIVHTVDGIIQQYMIRPISAEAFLASVRSGISRQRTKQTTRMGAFKRFLKRTKPARRATVNDVLTRALPVYWAKCWVGSDAEIDKMYETTSARLHDAFEGTSGAGARIADGMPVDRMANMAETVIRPFYGTDYVPAGQAFADKLSGVMMGIVDLLPEMSIPGLPAGQQPPPHPMDKRKFMQLFAAANEGASIMLPLMEAGMLDPDLAQFCQQHFPIEVGMIVSEFATELQNNETDYDVLLGFETMLGVPLTPTATPAAILASQQANQGANTPASAAATGMQRRGQVRMAGLSATDNELRQRRHERQGRA